MSIIAGIALLIATLIPALALFFIYRLDLYKTGTGMNILLSFLWGGMAYFIAAQINRYMLGQGWVTLEVLKRFSAPVLEEILKALLLVVLVRRPNFTYFVDGAIYGFASGIGFAIVENYEYILANPGAALLLAVSRALSTNLIHATGSGMIGISLGLARFERQPARFMGTLLAGLLTAMALHIGFNNMVNSVGGYLVLVYAISAGLIGAFVIGQIIRRGLREEKEWIRETLGEADRVTVQEASAVQDLAAIQPALRPIVERFGQRKAAEVQELLTMQARLGILRKSAAKLGDERMRQATEAQVTELYQKMEVQRTRIGMYPMMYLRSTYMEEDISGPVLNRLQERLQARPAGDQAGKGLWETATTRIQKTGQPENGRVPDEQ